MRYRYLLTIITAVIILVVPVTAISPGTSIDSFWMSKDDQPKQFTDLGGFEWATSSIDTLSKWGIISGYKDFTFKPEKNMTRSEFAKIVISAFGAYDDTAAVDMYDNPSNEWYYKYVSSAVKSGISKGYSDEFYGAADNILRQDIAVLAKRAMDYSGFSVNPLPTSVQYTDSDEIDDYALEAVEYLTQRGIFTGDDKQRFKPQAYAQRAEISVLIHRILTMGTPL